MVAYAQRLEGTGARLNWLVGDLVDVASIEAGVLGVRREVADPAHIVNEAMDNLHARAAEADFAHAELLPSLPHRF